MRESETQRAREREREREGEEREREREQKKKKREKWRTTEEGKRAGERASSMPTGRVSAGNKAPQVEFLSSGLPVL